MRGLSGKIALVTGGAGGVGSATSTRLAEEDARVVVADLDGDGATVVAERIVSAGGQAIATSLDVASRQSWAAAVSKATEALGPIQVLVNAAGVLRDKTFAKMDDDQWGLVLDVHLRGSWLGAQAVLASMRANGWGRIVNVSSMSTGGSFGQANYSAAKAGVIGLTRTLALETARHGILVNAVRPGAVDTAMSASVPGDVRQALIDRTPLRREADAEEIAALIAFLSSDDASFITGEVITIDGGVTLG